MPAEAGLGLHAYKRVGFSRRITGSLRIDPQAYVTIAGHGHLFPMSAPDEARRIIEAWLAGFAGG